MTATPNGRYYLSKKMLVSRIQYMTATQSHIDLARTVTFSIVRKLQVQGHLLSDLYNSPICQIPLGLSNQPHHSRLTTSI